MKIKINFWTNFVQIVCTILLMSGIWSCGPEKRLARIIKNNPQLVKRDTIFKIDTTVVNGVTHDTIFKSGITKDTLVIRDKQLEIRYYNDGKTTYIKGKCDTIRIIKEIPIQVNTITPPAPLTRWQRVKLFFVDNLAWFILIGFILWRLLKYLSKFYPIINKFTKL